MSEMGKELEVTQAWADRVLQLFSNILASSTPCQKNKVHFLIHFKLCIALLLVLANKMLTRYLSLSKFIFLPEHHLLLEMWSPDPQHSINITAE